MTIELSTATEPTPFELLDVLVQNRRDTEANRSLLSLHFVGRRGLQNDRFHMPLLTWFDANRLQQFTHQLANAELVGRLRSSDCHVDLPDAGLRLTAVGKGRHSIRIEALPSAKRRFTTVVLNSNATGLHHYARMLHTRLWEAFCRG